MYKRLKPLYLEVVTFSTDKMFFHKKKTKRRKEEKNKWLKTVFPQEFYKSRVFLISLISLYNRVLTSISFFIFPTECIIVV